MVLIIGFWLNIPWTDYSRMIRQSEGTTSEVKTEEKTQKDGALWAPTGWVHVEKDIDFSDPKVSDKVTIEKIVSESKKTHVGN